MDFSAGDEATFVKHLVSKIIFQDCGQSGRHIGEESDLVTHYNWGPHYVGSGFDHLIPGQFLDHQSRLIAALPLPEV